MGFITPGTDAGGLGGRRHGTAVVGAVAQKRRNQICIPGNKTGTQAGRVGALREAVKYQAATEVIPAQFRGSLQQTGRRAGGFRVDFRVAFIGGNDEIMSIGQPALFLWPTFVSMCMISRGSGCSSAW